LNRKTVRILREMEVSQSARIRVRKRERHTAKVCVLQVRTYLR